MLKTCAVVLLLFAVGCGPNPDDRCGHRTEAGACVTVVSVQAFSPIGDAYTSNVDAWRDICQVPDPVNAGAYMDEPEPFTDHLAVVTVSNIPPAEFVGLPTLAPIVTLNTYSVVFTTNECVPDGTPGSTAINCPNISDIEFEPGTTVSIAPDTTAEFSLPLVPLRKKFEYQKESGIPAAYSSYTASFTIGGHDNEGAFELEGSAEFTIGNFDLCP